MAYDRLNLKPGDPWKAIHVDHIQDAIEALDGALDSKIVDVEKLHRSSNRFDKNLIPFNNTFYLSNRLSPDFKFSLTNSAYGGGGWLNIQVEPGKTYTMSVREPVTLTDMNNAIYGVFINLWFIDTSGKVIMCVPWKGTGTYYYAVGNVGVDRTGLENTEYSPSKVICKAYGNGNPAYKGMQTNAMTFTVIDEEIAFMHVQIGATAFGQYQISADFNARGHLNEDEIAQIQNSFQINEGTELLDYEEGGDYVYTVKEVQSNLTKLQDAFTVKTIPSTNLLKPEYALNHKYISNGTLSNGRIAINSYGNCALLEIPVEVGSYVLHSSEVPIGNKKFGYFGKSIFTGYDRKYITGNYAYVPASGVTVGCDPKKVTISGEQTTTLRFTILDENIKYIYVPLQDSDKNGYGLWTKYEPNTGLTDEELFNLIYQMQLNTGTKVLKWQSYDDISTVTVVSPEYIDGLEDFQSNMEAKIDEAISNIAINPVDNKRMACIINDNNIYVKAKDWTSSNHFVWKTSKVNQSGGNKYFNIDGAYTCSSELADDDISSLSSWKGCSDDIFPCNINGTYIGANHGYNCVDRITVTAHGKQNVDIGSIWTCGSKKYVLVHIYNDNELGMVTFNDTSMTTGKMGYGSPSGTMTHTSGATNTDDIVIESRTSTQLWQCYNHYSINLLVDGKEVDLNTNGYYNGDRIEILTQYDIIYVPAMLQYLMDNVGNNDGLSQKSDDIQESYLTIYINYQFNRNGSISTYSSYLVNKNMSGCNFGLVQSGAIGQYAYIPDTIYKDIYDQSGDNLVSINFTKANWLDQNKVPYRFYQYSSSDYGKGMCLTYDRSIGYGNNEKRLPAVNSSVGMYYTSRKQYPQLISGYALTPNTFIDGMAARVPLYKYDKDLTSVGWYWSNEDIILMIDTHASVNKDIILPNYMNNMRIEVLDKTDSCNMSQTYIFNNKLRFHCTDYGYAVLRLYK